MVRVVGCVFFLFCLQCSVLYAQEPKVRISAYDGIIVLGYVDQGGFSNFTGPNINLVYKDSKFIVGGLPSLRFKNDTSTPKNAFVTPNLGIGFTYVYKYFAVQLPLFYNAKTNTKNGNWQIGIGLGLRLNALNSKTKKNEKI